MQPRLLLLSLLAALPCACKSARSPSAGPEGPSSPAGAASGGQGAGAQGGELSPANVQGQLAQDSAKVERQSQQQTFLAAESIKEGDTLLDRADLQGAL